MQKKKKTSVLRLNLNNNQRCIFISDIHGDLDLLKKGLAKVNFSKDDALFLLGDLIEKGDQNLAMLDYLMELKKDYNIYLLSGNCDEVLRFILPPVKKEEFLYYSLVKGHTIINEMAKKMDIKISKETNVDLLCYLFSNEFKKYYDFVDAFYDLVILNEKYILVHGGIDDLNDIPVYNYELLKYDSFYLKAKPSEYIRIVGHFPTINYATKIPSNIPIFDFDKNVISIDGGNKVKLAGQLNIVIMQNDMFNYTYVDNYEKKIAKKDIEVENLNPVHINSYLDSVCYYGEKEQDFYIVYNQKNEKCYAYYMDFLEKDDFFFCYDATNYMMNLKKGEEYSLIVKAEPFSIIKKRGIVGLIPTTVVNEDEL